LTTRCDFMDIDPSSLKSGLRGILPEGIPPLTSFYLYLTEGCNLACRHCWISPSFVKGSPDAGCLSLDLLKLAVSEAKPLGLNHAKLTGGEPTLHPQFREIVDFLTSESISLNMETNGTLIDLPLARYLKNNTTLRFISVSIDSCHPEIHDRFRGVPGSHEKAVSGIRNLVEAGYRPQIIMSPFRGNQHEIPDFIEFAANLGADSIKFNPVNSSGRGKVMHERGEALEFDEVLDLTREIYGKLLRISPISLSIMIPSALLSVRELLNSGGIFSVCRVHNILGILGTNELALCGIGRNVQELCFGKIEKGLLYDVWTAHPVLRELRTMLDQPFPGICGDCIHAKTCLTNCVAQNYLDSGKLIHPSSMCLEAEGRGLFRDTRRLSFSAF
jgi:SynChlorMet cassette radical SAM/SPASM protein ScmF